MHNIYKSALQLTPTMFEIDRKQQSAGPHLSKGGWCYGTFVRGL